MKLKLISRIHLRVIGYGSGLNAGEETFGSWGDESKFSWDIELEMVMKWTDSDL